MKSYASIFAALVAMPCVAVGSLAEIPTAAQSRKPPPSAPLGKGYLEPADEPDSLKLVPAPPPRRSAALARDKAVARLALGQNGTPRWDLARNDADLRLPQALKAFSCAAGMKLEALQSPRLIALMSRSLADLASSTSSAKRHYQRPRPFMENGRPTCTPDRDANQRRDGSYPSGHAAIGWGWALILAELLPERSDAILVRGRAFGESRITCNVHWLSDVEEGRFVGAATVAKLHANARFVEDLAAARQEMEAAKSGSATSAAECSAETEVLAAQLGA